MAPEQHDSPGRNERYGRGERSERDGRRERPVRGENFERRGGGRGEHTQRTERTERGERGERRGHAQRGGHDRPSFNRSTPQRAGFREQRLNRRLSEPDLPDDIDIHVLDPMVLQDLRVLSKDNADSVARHLFMAATLMADDPNLALRHARAAKERAGRVAVARETNGIAAYHAGEWKEALSELRAARRMSGGPGLLAVMADCERGLGRPEKALEIGRSEEAGRLDPEGKIELAIVLAGARLDLGQSESAVFTLQQLNPSLEARGVLAARLAYAYANALSADGRIEEAKQWFAHVVEIDTEELHDAQERLAELG